MVQPLFYRFQPGSMEVKIYVIWCSACFNKSPFVTSLEPFGSVHVKLNIQWTFQAARSLLSVSCKVLLISKPKSNDFIVFTFGYDAKSRNVTAKTTESNRRIEMRFKCFIQLQKWVEDLKQKSSTIIQLSWIFRRVKKWSFVHSMADLPECPNQSSCQYGVLEQFNS